MLIGALISEIYRNNKNIDYDFYTLRNISENPNTSPDLLKEMYEENFVHGIEEYIKDNPNTPKGVIDKINDWYK